MAAIAELPFPKSKKGMQVFLGALNHYNRFIQNMAVYGAALYQLTDADFSEGGDLTAAESAFAELKKRAAQAPILRHFDSAREVHIMLFANEWAPSSTLLQPHEEKLHPVRFCGCVLQENELGYHPTEKEVLALLHLLKICHPLLAGKTLHVYTRFSTLEWVFQSKSLYGRAVRIAVLLSPYCLKIKRVSEMDADFAQLLQATVTPHIGLDESLSHLSPPSKNSATVRLDPELLYAHVPTTFEGHVLPFDGSAKTAKNGGYGSCSWVLWRLPAWDIEIAASVYLPSTTVNIAEYTGMNNGVMAALSRGIADSIIVGDSRLAIQQSMGVIACKKETLQMELARHKKLTSQLSSVRYLHVVRYYNAAADSLATEALETQSGRVVLSSERKAELKVLNQIAEVLYAEADSVEPKAETAVMTRNQSRRVHFEDDVEPETTRGRPRRKKRAETPPSLSTEGGSNEYESEKAPPRIRRVEGQAEVEVDEDRVPDSADFGPAVVQAERRRRISKAQDEELKWADLKAFLRGELDELTHRRAQNAGKLADNFVLSEDGLLYYKGQRRRVTESDSADLALRLVAPTTMIDEILQSCHNSIEGGHQGIVRTFHRVTAEFYWVGLYADVVKHVQSCEDCSTSKSKPQLRGYSPGNVASEFPFEMVSMDFVIPLPLTRRGNTALLLFLDHFTGYVTANAMSETAALDVAKAFEECVFRRFGAPSLTRHDRDRRFMSEVFQAFAELMQSRPRATLSYRPQANGQQERSVKTMIQTIRVYVEDPLQADWGNIAENMVHAINNSRDSTRRETPFYLVHGWDAQSTLKAMTSTIRKDSANSAEATQWRREANPQREIAIQLAKEYQLAEKARRAEEHNARLRGKERKALPNSAESAGEANKETTEVAESASSLFKAGDQVWLFMERVKPGLKKKLAHRWHGPFRVKRKTEEFAYELELPEKSGYRFYPVVHVSRLKKVSDLGQWPSVPLVDELSEDQRHDFDEELLPEDSFELGEDSERFEVEAILDDEMPTSTSTSRDQRLFRVKWVGYDEPTWEPHANLLCGGLLFDYLRNKKRENRLQMVQVADED